MPYPMKPVILLAAIPAALAAGFFFGRAAPAVSDTQATAEREQPTRTREVRKSREDPFGGPSFSLDSLEDVSALFKNQRYNVAAARLTLAVDELPSKDVPRLMEMLREEFRKNPNSPDRSRWQLFSMLSLKWAETDPDAALAFIQSSPSRSFRLQAARNIFGGLAEADPARAIAEMQALPKGEMLEQVTSTIVSTIGKTDPEAAINLLEKEPSRSRWSDFYLQSIFADWAAKDPAAAAARAASLPNELVGQYSISGIANAWTRSDPDAALKWAADLSGENRSSAYKEIYTSLARENPEAAWERLRGEPGHLRGQIAGTMLGVIADESPDKAVAMLMAMDTPSEKRIAAGNLLDNLDWSNPRFAFEILEKLDDPVVRRERLPNILFYAAWSSKDFFKEQTAKLSDRDKLLVSGYMLNNLARTDFKAAQDFFMSLPEAQRKPDDLQQIFSNHLSKDTSAALDFALSLANPKEQTAALTGLFSKWSTDNPEAAAAGLKKLPAGEARLEALGTLANSWSQRDPSAALKWAGTLTGNERVRALSAVLPAMAKDDPAAASRQLSALLASPPDGMATTLASSASSLAATWAADDPASAASWSTALPEGSGKTQSLGAVATSWASYDAVAAAQWIGTLAAGESRDAAVKSLVQQVSQTDPSTAFLWAASIGEADGRSEQLKGTLESWRQTDLAAARAALQSSNLPEAEKTKLSKILE